MEILAIDCNDENVYELKEDRVNVIMATEGKLIMPTVSKLCSLKILFTEEGNFYIDAQLAEVGVGFKFSRWVELLPGRMGCDTQPEFVYIPHKNKWTMLGQGNIVLHDAEPIREGAK